MSMTPNTSVSPAASRNSIRPNCSPFSDCSRMRTPGIVRPWRRGGEGARAASLHRAALHVRVAVVLQDRLVERLVDQSALAVAADGANVVALDRVLVGVELER